MNRRSVLKGLLITFIYRRCPMPTACPRITSQFAEISERLSKNPQIYSASHLISITLDPDYDKPAVMRQYGIAYLDDHASAFSHWELADTTPSYLKKLANAFGLQYTAEDNQITHTMETTLIGPDGKVAQTWEGSSRSATDIVKAVENMLPKIARSCAMKTKNSFGRWRTIVTSRAVVWCAVIVISTISCSKPLTETEQGGKALYDMHCAQCHDENELGLKKVPPKLEGMAEAANVLNHRNDMIPNATWGAGLYPATPNTTFGQATAVGDPRSVQLAARITF